MRLGVVSDIHGNVVALDAVLADAAAASVDEWCALGDLVLFGPRPVEVIERLHALPHVRYVRGNTDRYVVTGEQPHPHATAVDAVGDVDLVERYGLVALAIGWTRGVLLAVHASPGNDDGPGIDTDLDADALSSLLASTEADVIVGGHTHVVTDRVVNDVRACNPGSVGMPRGHAGAGWLIVDLDHDGIRIEHRRSAFDVDAVVADLWRRRHPNAAFVESVLRDPLRRG